MILNFIPTYLKYKYIYSSFRFQVGSGLFFQLSRIRIRGKNVGSSSLVAQPLAAPGASNVRTDRTAVRVRTDHTEPPMINKNKLLSQLLTLKRMQTI